MKSVTRKAVRNYGFFVAAAVLIALGSYIVFSGLQFRRHSTWVAHTHEVMESLDAISRAQQETVSDVRGYLLTGRIEERDRFWVHRAQLLHSIEALPPLVADNPEQQARGSRLLASVRDRLRYSEGSVATYRATGSAESAPAIIHAEAISSVQNQIDALLHQMREAEEQLLALRARRSDEALLALVGGTAIGIPFSLFLLGYIYLMLRRENRERQVAERAAITYNEELNTSVRQLEQLSIDLGFLSNYSGMLQSSSTSEEMFEITRQALSGLLPEAAGTIYLLRASRDHADIVAHWRVHAVPSHPAPALTDCWAVRRNQPYFVDDVLRGVHCGHLETATGAGIHATACIPLSAQGELMGWLYLSGPGPGPLFGINLALNACEQLSLALANIRLRETLRHQALRDPLTGLFNRRYLEECLAREIARCQRRSLPLAVLMMDLDHFKSFNDRYGHAGGDAVLAAFGQLLQSRSRSEDIACRYGGEEFTLIMPEAPREIAMARAELLRESVAAMRVEHQGRPLPGVTLSIGIAMMPGHEVPGSLLMQAGDKALYAAKAAGRDRVHVAEL
ncbi:sensor domain-containing diguanylate cyclase [Arenimonas oryziterrae]|uniref:diguanylate cyclase n=1 Tax=Arenimonas oryziterrae DSM 21050 = YC6267 TaxID=1121015 RepID=A0A091AQV9_9GAMM|nr:diguanylate cyclase [Arenimonas oryziterrae]KFN42553.1 hypothetical protein N789_13010 [Arenimonas oryziterrae DSM 21050 = YC6267]